MARAVKIFQAYVENKAGWDFPQATVVIHRVSEASQKTFDSEDCKGNYVEEISSHIISYSANFWKDKATQAASKPTMPLFDKFYVDAVDVCEKDEDGEDKKDADGELILTGEVIDAHWDFSDIFEVDVDHPQSIQVLNSNASSDDKIFTLIELDLVRRFKR